MKYCKDCKHHVRGVALNWCNRKNAVDKDAINHLSSSCQVERSYNFLRTRIFDGCGREGRFYEPKETP